MFHTILIYVFGLFLVAGAILFMFDIKYAEYIFSFGTLLAVIQAFIYAIQNRTTDRRIQRLHRLYFVASLFLIVAAWFMFINNTSWVPFVVIYAMIVFFLSFRN